MHWPLAATPSYGTAVTLNELLATPGVTSEQVQRHLAELRGDSVDGA